MKKTLIITVLTILSVQLSAQIRVDENIKPVLIGKVQHFSCKLYSNIYVLTYNDYKFTQVDDYKSFSLSVNDFEALYKVIHDGFDSMPENPIRIETPMDVLELRFTKVMGTKNLQITHFVNKNPEVAGLTKHLTLKAVDKLFGKR